MQKYGILCLLAGLSTLVGACTYEQFFFFFLIKLAGIVMHFVLILIFSLTRVQLLFFHRALCVYYSRVATNRGVASI